MATSGIRVVAIIFTSGLLFGTKLIARKLIHYKFTIKMVKVYNKGATREN